MARVKRGQVWRDGDERMRGQMVAVLSLLNATPGIYAWKISASEIIGCIRVHLGMGCWERCAHRRCFKSHTPAWIAVTIERSDGKPPTPAQLDFLARLREAGSPLARVVTSVDQVRRAVERL